MLGETAVVAATEAPAQEALLVNPVRLLNKFMADCPDSPASWVKESMTADIELLQSHQVEVQSARPSPFPLRPRMEPRPSQGRSSTGRLRVDFALVSASSAGAASLSASSAGAAGPSASSAGRYFSVAEIKRLVKLMQAGVLPPTPLGLINLYAKVPADSLSTSVRIMLDQLWTYMVLTGVEFGWISCYYFTWLAWRPSDHPERMCLSRPYHHDVDGDDGVTVMGALSWLQEQIVARLDRRHCIPNILPPSTSYHHEDSADEDGSPDDGGRSPDEQDPPYPQGEGRTKR